VHRESLFSVDGRAVVVTGASAGLGERFARVLAANGARVLAVARREDRLQALAAEVPGIVPHRADVSVAEDRAAAIDAAVGAFGRVDVLVNNAGGGGTAPATEEDLDGFRAAIELNLTAVFDLARLAARRMLEAGTGGSIVNIASIMGHVASAPIPNASYTAAKGGVVNLTRELGCQWARKGVRVNAISPGYFPSESTSVLEGPALDYIKRNCPMGRMGHDGELDGILLFLASDASTYCTGQTFTVDGGWTAR
jgi:NAD(P)-dependent dehydrogenase (short-subunit alcohol dehydrogenase family)